MTVSHLTFVIVKQLSDIKMLANSIPYLTLFQCENWQLTLESVLRFGEP